MRSENREKLQKILASIPDCQVPGKTEIDKGVVYLVRAANAVGFQVNGFSEGTLDPKFGYPYPWVNALNPNKIDLSRVLDGYNFAGNRKIKWAYNGTLLFPQLGAKTRYELEKLWESGKELSAHIFTSLNQSALQSR